jgi:ATP adenylyltransferase
MVGRVLTKNRGITTKEGDTYQLVGESDLSEEQRHELMRICDESIDAYQQARGEAIWSHRRRGHRPISGSNRYEVLARAGFRCELCGVAADERNLEVDHIHPKSLGGKDGLENYQALCYSCNAAKRNTDNEDFRELKALYARREAGCLFCEVQISDRKRIVAENTMAYAIRDAFPVTLHHTLIMSKRHGTRDGRFTMTPFAPCRRALGCSLQTVNAARLLPVVPTSTRFAVPFPTCSELAL